jgi:hypothetical protein
MITVETPGLAVLAELAALARLAVLAGSPC